MKNPIVNFLSCLSRASLDPALGGRGLAISRILSLATFAAERGDAEALAVLNDLTGQMVKVINEGRDLIHEEWNDLQAAAESGHWFLRTSYPQRAKDGGIVGGHQVETGMAEKPVDQGAAQPASPAQTTQTEVSRSGTETPPK